MTLTLTALPDIPHIRSGDDLGAILLSSLAKADLTLRDGDIIVLAQKIVSKAEGRLVNLTQVTPSPRAIDLAGQVDKDARFVELVLRESREVVRTRPGTLIVEHRQGFICANAGIDHSNVEGSWGDPEDWVLLLPVDADASAEKIRRSLIKDSALNVGVMIIDSHGRAWRNGVVGVCIGLSGLPALVDLRGEPDMLGFKLRITQVATADELAAGASLLMGQASEGTPAIHVRGFPYPLRESSLGELIRTKETDLFR